MAESRRRFVTNRGGRPNWRLNTRTVEVALALRERGGGSVDTFRRVKIHQKTKDDTTKRPSKKAAEFENILPLICTCSACDEEST